MRPLILAALIVLGNATQVASQTMPTFPPSTFPEARTFCGVLILCPKTAPEDAA